MIGRQGTWCRVCDVTNGSDHGIGSGDTSLISRAMGKPTGNLAPSVRLSIVQDNLVFILQEDLSGHLLTFSSRKVSLTSQTLVREDASPALSSNRGLIVCLRLPHQD